MEKCFICEKHKGNYYASKFHVTSSPLVSIYHMFPQDEKVYLGHTFIETIRHVTGLDKMSIEEASEIGKCQIILRRVFKKYFEAEHVYSFVFGDGVPHLHLHIIPRYIGAPKEYRGTRVDEWDEAPHGNEKETIEFCKLLGEMLKEIEAELV